MVHMDCEILFPGDCTVGNWTECVKKICCIMNVPIWEINLRITHCMIYAGTIFPEFYRECILVPVS